MYYYTTYFTKNSNCKNMTIMDLLFGNNIESFFTYKKPTTYTVTRKYNELNPNIVSSVRVNNLIEILKEFNNTNEAIRNADRNSLYHSFYIPKKSGGLRKIDAPLPELMTTLRSLKYIFEEEFKALYHTSAFAYVKGRSTIDALKKHQSNNSRWFLKLDISNFFGSITPEFVMKQLSIIFPFCEVIKIDEGRDELRKAIDLAFLNGVLPQGTPISPLLTNLIMIPIDYTINKQLLERDEKFVYTRYSDDFLISSKYDFKPSEIGGVVSEILNRFQVPFSINNNKTRYGSSSGRNWNLGLMLNKDNKITVGYKNKRRFKAMLTSYVTDKINGNGWRLEDIQAMEGLRSYYTSVEKEVIDDIVNKIGNKFGVNIISSIKEDLKNNVI